MPSHKPRDPRHVYDPHKPRRSHNDGSIYQLADGTWCVAITVTNQDGTKRRIVRQGATKAVAIKRIRTVEDDIASGQSPAGATVPLATYLERWLTDAASQNLTPGSLRDYRTHCKAVTVTLGAVKLGSLTQAQIQHLYAAWGRAGVSPATVRVRHAVLHRALEQAVRWQVLPRNPAEHLDLPQQTPRDVPPFSVEETRRLLDTADADGDRLSALWTVLATTALRVGEALGLEWRDVDLDGGTLTVRQQLRQAGDFARPKSRSGRRRLLLMQRTIAALRAHRARQAADQLAAGNWPASDLVFRGALGLPVSRSAVEKAWPRFLEQANLREIHRHDLRRGLSTFLAEAGENPRVVQSILGHSNAALTLDTYTSVTAGMQASAVKKLDELLG